jgi:hypothetical protein
MRVLDELAQAIHLARGGQRPRRIIGSDRLADQFGWFITLDLWSEFQQCLGCELPSLQVGPRFHWAFPNGWSTVWDLADYVSARHVEWLRPRSRDVREWQEAQIFAGVRDVLADIGVDEEAIVRSARLVEDLGLY